MGSPFSVPPSMHVVLDQQEHMQTDAAVIAWRSRE